MVQLRDRIEELHAVGVQIVGVSYDPIDVLKKFSDSEQIPFPLLSDEGSKTIRAYGLHYQDGLPHPGTILVNPSGVICAKLFKEGYVTRHTIDELLSVAEELE